MDAASGSWVGADPRMDNMNAWWWFSVPYSIAFPALVLAFRLREGIGHGAALFFLIGVLTMVSSVVWLFMTVRRVATGKETVAPGRIVKPDLALVAVILWVALFAVPE